MYIFGSRQVRLLFVSHLGGRAAIESPEDITQAIEALRLSKGQARRVRKAWRAYSKPWVSPLPFPLLRDGWDAK